tara:strand:+ start:242 stop:1426 length:1185 start_codon:yes stop_codon:yes gene_type:complete
MQILLITNLYPPQELGGYGRSMADFAWGLMQSGHHVQVLCANAPHLGEEGNGPSGEEVSRCLTLKGSFEGGLRIDRDPKRCADIDRINQKWIRHWLGRCQWHGALVGNIDLLGHEILHPLMDKGLPTVHHIGFVTPPFDPALTPATTNYQLVCASHAVKKSLIKAGMPITGAPVVYPGARVEMYGSHINMRSLPALPLPSKGDPLKICFAGIHMSSKGSITLLAALAILKKRNIPTYCMLAGELYQKTYAKEMHDLIEAEQLQNNVQFAPQLTRQQLSRFFMLHHVCVFPSIYPEAFGIVCAEAMASGLALISSGVGGAAEIFEDGISGLSFKAGDSQSLAEKLEQLWRNPLLLEGLQKNGEQRIRGLFNVQNSAKALEAIFLNIQKKSNLSTP